MKMLSKGATYRAVKTAVANIPMMIPRPLGNFICYNNSTLANDTIGNWFLQLGMLVKSHCSEQLVDAELIQTLSDEVCLFFKLFDQNLLMVINFGAIKP